jgi:hypothetical protein
MNIGPFTEVLRGYMVQYENTVPLLIRSLFFIFLVFNSLLCFLFCLSSSSVLFTHYCQFLWIFHSWLPYTSSPQLLVRFVLFVVPSLVFFVVSCRTLFVFLSLDLYNNMHRLSTICPCFMYWLHTSCPCFV